ncbi:MAG: zinc-dependent metalloprotease [Flavobacteriaceae bacterium]
MKSIHLIIFYCFSMFFLNSQENLNNDIEFNGFFDFKYEEKSNKIFLEVDKLNYDFLYIHSLTTGLGSNDIGLDRGQLGDQKIVRFKKYGNKLLLIQPNQKYRAYTDNILEKKSVKEAFAFSVIYGFEIIDSDSGSYKIDLTPFLMQDAHGVSDRLNNLKQGNYKIDLSKSSIELTNTKAFPKNVEFEALLTYKGKPNSYLIPSVSPDSKLISLIQHHSFIELPDDDYSTREFDPRSGAIMTSYMDYATEIEKPIIKRKIIRHRLKKKNVNSEYSEPEEPIIYYLDPGTPEPVKSALIEGALWWNDAFEEIGFKNAFQVKVLPEGADPMDCRYNMIQWVHRSTRGWSYGASVVDPRTGEIIKGHVSLGSLRIRQDFLIAQSLMNRPYEFDNDNDQPMLELALARIRQLSAHEVGHTLGFAHNFASSSNNRASVMDYPHPLLAINKDGIDFSNSYSVGIGDWDKVSVAYSYSEINDQNEKPFLDKILENAYKKGLRFITDSDARSSSGSHVNAHLWDNGKNVTQNLNEIFKIREKAISNFSEYNIKKGEPFSKLEDLFVPLYFMHRYQTEAVIKLIGGMDYNYSTRGDGQLIVKDLEYKIQNDALQSVLKSLDAKHLTIPKNILNLFPPRAYGYPINRESFKGRTGVSFDPFSAAQTASEFSINLLLNTERLNRIKVQSSVNSSRFNLNKLFDDILSSTFGKNHKDEYLNEIQHIINTNILTYLLKITIDKNAFVQVQNTANKYINLISNNYFKSSKVHYEDYQFIIKDFKINPESYKGKISKKIPDGSPIGSESCNYF